MGASTSTQWAPCCRALTCPPLLDCGHQWGPSESIGGLPLLLRRQHHRWVF